MPGEYLDGPVKYADSDGEFLIWKGGDEAAWERRSCDRLDCDRMATLAEGGRIIATAVDRHDWYLEADSANFWCAKHAPFMITSKDVIDEVTTALFDHDVDPHVIADVSSRLDGRLNLPEPDQVVDLEDAS